MDTQPLCTIVGMGRGISRSVARRFAAEGFRIGMIARDGVLLKELETEIPGSHGVPADAGDEAGLRAALRELGSPEVLVYNASASHPNPPSTLGIEDAISDFRVNALGAVIAVQEALPSMRAAGKGTVLLTGGGLALGPMAQVSSLSMGKAAIRNLTFALAEELEPSGIHVATITVCGFVQPGTPFDPDRIAEVYWNLHQQPREQFEREVIYR